MSLRVDLGLVHFSQIEDIYYFYDPQHPSSVQFLLNGQWESWDVGWVKHHAHDPEIKQIAAEAEAYVIRYWPTYEQWHSTPVPRVATLVPPFSPSVESDVSRQREHADHYFSHQEDSSSSSSRDIHSPTSVNASWSSHSGSHAAFSPASNLPPISRPPLAIDGRPAMAMNDSRPSRLRSGSSSTSHTSTEAIPTPSPGSSLDFQLPGLPPLGHRPPDSPLTPYANSLHTAFTPPSSHAPPNSAIQVLKPAPETLAHASESQLNSRAKEGSVPLDFARSMDPQGRPKDSPTNSDLQATPRPAPKTFSPNSSHGMISQEAGLGISVHAQPPPSSLLLPRRTRDCKIILSLDGDGIRGLSQVFLVEALVGAICTKVDQNIAPYQIFDLIAGTSMGGALGLMLSRLRMQAHKAREAYKLLAKEVFQDKKAFFLSLDSVATPIQYEAQGVEDAIKNIITAESSHVDEPLYDGRQDSSNSFTITAQVKIGSKKAAILRTYLTERAPGSSPDTGDDAFLWQAMKAAVLAPRSAASQDGRNSRSVIKPSHMDYGTVKDNPVSEANYEIRKLSRFGSTKTIIVSIGTGSGLNSDLENREMAEAVVRCNADAERQNSEFQKEHDVLIKSGWMKFFRFNVPNLDDVPLEEWCNEEQLRNRTTAYLASPDTGHAFHKCVNDIAVILGGIQQR